MATTTRNRRARCSPRRGRARPADDGHRGAGARSRTERPVRALGPVHPRPRGDGADQSGTGEARHHPPPSRVRQPLVHPVGRREHGPQHRARRDVRAGPAGDRRPPEDPDRARRLPRREHRRGPAAPRARPASSAACCSGSTSPARTSRPSRPPRSWRRTSCRAGPKAARSSAPSSGPARRSSSGRRG